MDTGAAFFRSLVEASRDGLWVLDGSGTTTYANHRMAQLLGRDPDDLLGLSAYDVVDELGRGDLDRHLAALAAAPDDDEGADNLAVMLQRSDGTAIWVLASHSPIRDDSGRRVGWLHRVTENTEQKHLMESLRKREQLLAAAQSIASIGSWEWDVATDTVTWSDQLYRIYNVEPEEFEATYHGFLEFIHPDDRGMVEAAVGSIFAGEDEFAWDSRVIRRGGEQRWVRGLGRADRAADGSVLRMGGTAQDITERVRADQVVAEATRRLHLLQAIAATANSSSDLDEAVHLAATVLPDFTGWRAVCAHRWDAAGEARLVPLAGAARGWLPEPDHELAERCRRSRAVEHTPAPGHETTHSVVALPVLLDGSTTCVIEVLADEAPLDGNSRTLVGQISQHLGQVAQREAVASELARARDAAMEASRLKSEFLATMSHEIRTPMNGVIGLTDLLLRTELDPHQRRLAEGLRGAGSSLLTIINDILDLSKIEAGKLELEDTDFDVRSVFDRTADVLSGPAHAKGLELVVACHPDVPRHLRGDPGRLGQVLANLGSNAVKFTESGEVSIRARVEDVSAEHVLLRVDVADTGIGVNPDLRPVLFDAFTQADPSTTSEHGGTGLGLAISRQLVTALGGDIELASESGAGSVFSFTARFAHATGMPSEPAPPADPERLRGRRVLVVDDNATNRLILDEELSAWDMLPTPVATVAEAMAALREAGARGVPYDMAVLDLVLPDGDGLSLARAITAATPGSTPRLLLLSSGQVDAAAARAAGIAVSLSKPVRQSELVEGLVTAATSGAPAELEVTSPAKADPGGQRILVVEDNEVNQMVAVGLLESAGYAADVVGDGVQAVTALAGDHGYAAVLMDCRMPRLDGFDATRRIRSEETAGRRVPIIAMTASALEGEQQRCAEAGMDDFLTKPVDAGRMVRVLRRWAGGDASAPVPLAPEPVSAVVDRARMRMLDGLHRDGQSLFQRAAVSFETHALGNLADLRSAVADLDGEALAAHAHRLKGSATNLGLPALGQAAGELEDLGHEGRLEDAAAALGRLATALDHALTALAEIREAGP